MKYMLLCGLAASMLSIAAAVPARADGDDGQFTGGPFGWSYSAGPQMNPQFTDRSPQPDRLLTGQHRDALAAMTGAEEDTLALPGFILAPHDLR